MIPNGSGCYGPVPAPALASGRPRSGRTAGGQCRWSVRPSHAHVRTMAAVGLGSPVLDIAGPIVSIPDTTATLLRSVNFTLAAYP